METSSLDMKASAAHMCACMMLEFIK